MNPRQTTRNQIIFADLVWKKTAIRDSSSTKTYPSWRYICKAMYGRQFKELPQDIHCNSIWCNKVRIHVFLGCVKGSSWLQWKTKPVGCFLANGHCQTGKFESRVQSNKLSVYRVGMVMEALACHHRTREVLINTAGTHRIGFPGVPSAHPPIHL